LHTEVEAACRHDRKGLDKAIGRERLDTQAVREPVHALAVDRVDADPRLFQHACEHAAGLHEHVVRQAVLHLGRGVFRRAMVVSIGYFLDRLVQRSAERHVRLLKPAADREQRDAAFERSWNQRQCPGIAIGIEWQRRVVHVFGEVTRMHVRLRAGQQHTVGEVEQRIEFVGEIVDRGGRHEQRRAACQAHRVDVLLAGDVKRVVTQHAVASGHEHHRFGSGGGRC
jgi:hypothetical protein